MDALIRLHDNFPLDDEATGMIVDAIADSLLNDYSIDTRGDVGSQLRDACLVLLARLPIETITRDGRIMGHLLEQVFGRLDRLRPKAVKLLLASLPVAAEEARRWRERMDGLTGAHAAFIAEFGSFLLAHIAEPVALEGLFRGLVYAGGGLDPQLAAAARQIARDAVNAQSFMRPVFEQLVLRVLAGGSDGRLVLPAITTLSLLHRDTRFSSSFLADAADRIKTNVIGGRSGSNIRRLLPAFRLLLEFSLTVDGLDDFLREAASNHPYPSVRQLITEWQSK